MIKDYFKLKGIEYKITGSQIGVYETEEGIQLFPEIMAESDQVEEALSKIRLYHNNGFQTGVKEIGKLLSQKFVWKKSVNSRGEEAGFLYVVEHEDVTSGTIEVLEVSKKNIVIKWEGKANVLWNKEFGANVPFETVVKMKLPTKRKVTINAYKSVKTKINKDLGQYRAKALEKQIEKW